MLKVGITGQSGFIGNHLYNTLALNASEFVRIPFEDEFFQKENELRKFVASCDVIIHLAAMNRHQDSSVIYETNIELINQLITALECEKSKAHVIFASSIQEETDSVYGKSKHDGRNKLADWAKNSGAQFTGLIIPNVFGPFGLPFYNSVIATFCHQIAQGETPEIQVDKEIPLLYIDALIDHIIQCIREKTDNGKHLVQAEKTIGVSDLLKKITTFHDEYFNNNKIPALLDKFNLDLFNTYRSFISHDHFPVVIPKHQDDRGYLVVTMQERTGGQSFYSITKPGITRGNHFHKSKIERFCIVKGDASIKWRKIGSSEIREFIVSGENPSVVDIPVWYTHNLTNIGNGDLVSLFWSNQIFDKNDNDTFYEEVS